MAEEETKEQTLDDVYSQFNVEQAAQEFQATPTPKEPEKPAEVPDPTIDLEGFKSWGKKISSQDDEIRQTLYSINERLTKQDQERIRGQEEADLQGAIDVIKEGNEALQGKDKLLKAYLNVAAYDDPKLRTVWESRNKNPDAWNAVISVMKNQVAKEFNVTTDPQLAENQRAMKVSRNQMATTPKVDADEKWKDLDQGEFQQEWSRLVSGGTY